MLQDVSHINKKFLDFMQLYGMCDTVKTRLFLQGDAVSMEEGEVAEEISFKSR